LRDVNDRCVLFFGDSFVNGAGDPSGQGWVGRVVAAAWTAGVPLTHYNLGIRGETSLQVERRFRSEAPPRLMDGADNRVVIAVGANDGALEGPEPSVAPDASTAALEGMLEAAGRAGAGALVLGPGPVGEVAHDERSRALADGFAAVCERRDVPFLPILDPLLANDAWRDEAAGNDGLHPGAGGYSALAEIVLAWGWIDWLRG